MSLKWNIVVGRDTRLQSQLNITFRNNSTSFHRLWRRPRLKRSAHLVIRNHHQLSSSSYSSSQDNLFHAFLSQLNSLDLLAPALGFTTALAILYNSTTRTTSTTHFSHQIGDWTLYTSPTPFNRFVKLRCASLLIEDSNEKLIEEEGHLVSLDTGRIHEQILVNDFTNDALGKQLSYQRRCVNTDDGGVVSLDWPTNLDLTKEHGLDTTILIIPGTPDGSMDVNVRTFVCECLTRGCFPIVMNPRGCARSPLTTPRLFTAADSDDICTTVQFINRARPWTTLMGVGMGYGANMLTKYLAQVGEETPLTAATCLDNPFDLKMAANHLYIDQNLTSGFIDMLQSNKELFQGRSKGFDIKKALQAKSLKDFEEAISMVSYGFDSIEEFYVNSSTRDVIGNVKIPLLFIQNNAVASSSVPRSLIAENPFTSLLICNSHSDDESKTLTYAVSWCQHLVVEWLTAVELGLLKGRHPLLEDTDVSINPSRRLKLMASKASDHSDASRRRNNNNNLVNLPQVDALKKMLKRSDAYPYSSSNLELQKSSKSEDKEVKKNTNGAVTQTNVVDTELMKEGDVDLEEDSERGQVLQATEVMMNMLDVTMPDTLSEEQKRKVLTAVGQGETLINALQGAVPEDVRGKLTSSVTAILENQKKNLNGLSTITRVPALNTKMQEKSGLPSREKEPNTSDHNKEDFNNHPTSKNNGSGGVEEHEANNGTSGKSDENNSPSQVPPSHHGDELGSNNRNIDFSKEKAVEFHDSDSNGTANVSSKPERSDEMKEDQISGHEGEMKEEKDNQQKEEKDNQQKDDKDNQQKEEKDNQQKDDKDNQQKEKKDDQKSISNPKTEESMSSPSVSSPETEKEEGENQKKEESSSAPAPSPAPTPAPAPQAVPSSNSPSFNVSQALDALTGMDDSTQVAVNSVFSVIEGMITQLEGNRNDDESSSVVGDKNDSDTDSESMKHHTETHAESESGLQHKGDEPNESSNHQITKLSMKEKNEAKNILHNQNSIGKLAYRNTLYDNYLQSHLLSKMKDNKSHDSDALFLDYVPEEGKWKLLDEQSVDDDDDDATSHENVDDVIEPTYVILDAAEGDLDEFKKIGETKMKLEIDDDELMELVKENILNSLKVEVCRRIQAKDMEEMAPMLKKELEDVADTISLAVVHDKQLDAISSAVEGTTYMKKIIPVGIVIGSTLASLRKTFNIDSIGSNAIVRDQMVTNKTPLNKANLNDSYEEDFDNYEEEKDSSTSLRNDSVMVGAVTAALGASALLVHQQGSYGDGVESSSMSFNRKENHQEADRVEEETSESSDQNNIVTSLAEKAMLVAGPVVPTKEGGGVDQERLVAILADLGQKGGILKLVGKVALLWGGIRGAMSLTGKLISFLRLSERPLFQRILGFVSMVLVLWTPVVAPLLPTLVQNWASHTPSKFAELACIIGLYSSIMILVVLWGKRIRGYEDPLERYGLELTSAKQVQEFACGLIGGVTLVLLIQSINVLLGFVSVSWPTIPHSTDAVTFFKLFGKVIVFVGQGLVTTTAIALVEELLFRSWLPEEIAVDLGYNRGIILSGLAFSLSQWSLKAIPGLWLLSLGLAGVRQKRHGSLSLPIGLRAGIMASSFILKEGRFLNYQHTYPLWLSWGGDVFQPFTNIIGVTFALLWAVILYPKKPQNDTNKHNNE